MPTLPPHPRALPAIHLNTQQIDFTRANPLTGQQINYKQFQPGTIADIPRGMQ
ncbi:MAG TPA: hypothetical protein VK395_21870 [Gemmataceae bacterium]|nr:hypothetical protein [Gemmataceae bacterium]